MKNEFSVLVRDIRLLIQSRMRLIVPREKTHPTTYLGTSMQQQAVKRESSSCTPIPTIEKTPVPRVKAKTATPQQPSAVKTGDWELQITPSVSDPPPLLKKLATYTQTREPTINVLLILPEENTSHRLFLENVSRAVTRTFAPATVMLYHEKLLHNPPFTLILAPLTLLHKKFPDATSHVPHKMGNTTWIPLENLDVYTNDVNSKRTLWAILKQL